MFSKLCMLASAIFFYNMSAALTSIWIDTLHKYGTTIPGTLINRVMPIAEIISQILENRVLQK